MRKVMVLTCLGCVVGLLMIIGCEFKPSPKNLFKEKVDKILDSMDFQEPLFHYYSNVHDPLTLDDKEIKQIFISRTEGKNYYYLLRFKLSEKELFETEISMVGLTKVFKQKVSVLEAIGNKEIVYDEEAKKVAFDFSLRILDEILKIENYMKFIEESSEVLKSQKIKDFLKDN